MRYHELIEADHKDQEHPDITRYRDRGAFDIRIKPHPRANSPYGGYENSQSVEIHPKTHPGIQTFVPRTGRETVGYYDPSLADH